MNKSYLALSIAAVLGTGAAGMANASNSTPQLVVYAGGGSAEPGPVQVAFCSLFSNVDNFSDAGAAQSGDYLILEGVAKGNYSGNNAITSGETVMLMYKFSGGSYPNGAIPQAGTTGTTLAYPAVSVVLSGGQTTSTVGNACTTTNNGKPTYSYTATTATATTANYPDFGITDIDAASFAGFNNYNIPTTVSGPVTVGNPDEVYDLVEAVAVTDTLYQLKNNFTRAEMKQILDGSITNFNQLEGKSGAPLPSQPMLLIDRNVGSGTKAVGTQYFLGYPGLFASAQTAAPQSYSGLDTSASCTVNSNNCYTPLVVPVTSYEDVQESSAQNVANALITANNSSQYAVAILSADVPPYANPGASGGNAYDFVAINGVTMDQNNATDNINGTVGSSYINVINGSYDFFYQVGFNQRQGFSSAFATAIKGALSAPSLAGVVAHQHFPLAAPGIVLDGDNASGAVGVTITSRNGVAAKQVPDVVKKGVTVTVGSDPL